MVFIWLTFYLFNKFDQTAYFHNNAIDPLLLVENLQIAQACKRFWEARNWQEQAFETLINRLPSQFEWVKLQTNKAIDLAIKRAIQCAKPRLGWEQGSGQSKGEDRLREARSEV